MEFFRITKPVERDPSFYVKCAICDQNRLMSERSININNLSKIKAGMIVCQECQSKRKEESRKHLGIHYIPPLL